MQFRVGTVVLAGVACGPTASPSADGSEDGAASEAQSDQAGELGTDPDEGTTAGTGDDETGPSPETGMTSLDTGSDDRDVIWERTFDGETHNRDVGVCVTAPADDTIVVGAFEVLDPFGGESRSWLAALDGAGDLVWLQHEPRVRVEAVATSASGRVLAAGAVPAAIEGTGWRMLVESRATDGSDEWSIDEPGDSAYDVAVVGEDTIAVGRTAGTAPVAWITRRDSAGDEVFTVPTTTGTGAVAVVADGETMAVAGVDAPGGADVLGTWIWTLNSSSGAPVERPRYYSGWTPLALDRDDVGPVLLAFDGTRVTVARSAAAGVDWSVTFDESTIPRQFEWDVTIDPMGAIIVAGSAFASDDGARLLKFTPDGELVWERTHAPAGDVQVNGVATTPRGEIITVGAILHADTDWDIWVARWSP